LFIFLKRSLTKDSTAHILVHSVVTVCHCGNPYSSVSLIFISTFYTLQGSIVYTNFLFSFWEMCVSLTQFLSCRNGLSAQTKQQMSLLETFPDDTQDSREERAFRLWMNSLGNSTYINNVFEDLRNGWNTFCIFTCSLVYVILYAWTGFVKISCIDLKLLVKYNPWNIFYFIKIFIH